MGKNSDRVTCYVYNKSYEDICVTYDVYQVWYFLHQHVERYLILLGEKPGAPLLGRSPPNRRPMQANLFQQGYMPWNDLCQ